MKQETLEEAAENYTIAPKHLHALKLGAKWQAERMYSEEEVIELLRKSHFVEQNIDEWFEQFKKK